MSKSYPSNLTLEQWELLEPLLPDAKRRGRPRTDLLLILNAIFYVLREGCTWRGLPGDFPAWQTVYTYFRNWRREGTWIAIHDRLYQGCRVDPIEARWAQHAKPAVVEAECMLTVQELTTRVCEYFGCEQTAHLKQHVS